MLGSRMCRPLPVTPHWKPRFSIFTTSYWPTGIRCFARGAPPWRAWGLQLPDLKSRLQGATQADLQPPDDTLLAAVLAKQFNDHQIVPKSDVIPYLVAHMDRSFAMARSLVATLNRESLEQKRAVTRPLAASVLEKLQS